MEAGCGISWHRLLCHSLVLPVSMAAPGGVTDISQLIQTTCK